MAGSILSSASLILFMLVFTIWSGVPGQAAPPGVGRAVLFEPVRLDSTVPRPTEDTVMRDCLCPMLFYLLSLRPRVCAPYLSWSARDPLSVNLSPPRGPISTPTR